MLSLGVKKGSKIVIGGQPVRRVVPNQKPVVVRVDGGTLLTVEDVLGVDEILIDVAGQKFKVTNLEKVQVAPNVFVSSGRDEKGEHATGSYTRLCFEAPLSVNINRVPNA